MKSRLQIHYYFNDSSHSMDAIARNRAEKDFLDAIVEVSTLLNIDDFKIESEAYAEGGLIETLTFIGVVGVAGLKYFAPSLNKILGHFFTLERKIEKEKLKALELENKTKELELYEKILENPKLKRYSSSFFKKADEQEKIIAIGFNDLDVNKESIVKKEDFKKFILEDNTDIVIDNKARIKIVAPVLEDSKHLWKGFYKDKTINFSMADRDFKNGVISKRYKFSNGNHIICELQITSKYDDTGELVGRPAYSVKKVFEILDSSGINTVTKKGEEKKIDDKQGIFDLYPKEDKE